MDANERKGWFLEHLGEKRIIARTDFDGVEDQVDRDALRDDFDGWYQRIDEAEDKKLNINNVLDENFPTEALIEALDTEEDFQNFTVQHNIEINFEGWGDEDKRRYRGQITQSLRLDLDSLLLKAYNVSVAESAPEISNELAIGYVDFSSQDELGFDLNEWEAAPRIDPTNQSAYNYTYADLLFQNKNIILEGPPGTGKTFALKGIVQKLSEEKADGGLGKETYPNTGRGKFAVTMHPSTSYEDFIEGLRPTDDGTSFAYRPGSFVEIVKHAIRNPNHQHVVLLDELNRCNVPSVMGDLLTVVERGKRSKRSLSILGSSQPVPAGECVEVNWLTATNCTEPNGAQTGLGMSIRQLESILEGPLNIVTNPMGEQTDLWEVLGRHRFRMRDNFSRGDYYQGHDDGNTLLHQEPEDPERLKAGLCLIIWDGIGHPVLTEHWQKYLLKLEDAFPDADHSKIKILTEAGVKIFEVCDENNFERTRWIEDKRRGVGKLKLREPEITCTCDEEEDQSEYYWCMGCDSNWSMNNRTEVRLSGSRKLLHIPENLLIVGTMNTTDRSVAPLDAALRRRFMFLRVDPLKKIDRHHSKQLAPVVRDLFFETHRLWQKMNKKLETCLGSDATLGHSYLFDLIENLKENTDAETDAETAKVLIRNCWKYAILPQIADMLDATGQAKEIWNEVMEGETSEISVGLEENCLKLKFGESKSMAFNRTVVVEVPPADDDEAPIPDPADP